MTETLPTSKISNMCELEQQTRHRGDPCPVALLQSRYNGLLMKVETGTIVSNREFRVLNTTAMHLAH